MGKERGVCEIMSKYKNATKDYLFALLISGNTDEKGDALCELCDRYKEINYYAIKRLAMEHEANVYKGKFNENEMQFIALIEEARRYVKGEVEIDYCDGEWIAMDYMESCGSAFPINAVPYNIPLISKKEAKRKNINILECCKYCGVYYVGE